MNNENRKTRLTAVLVCGVALLGIIGIVWLALRLRSPSPVAGPATAAAPAAAAAITQATQQQAVAVSSGRLPAGGRPPSDWGIEVVGVYPAVGGRVLDLRYKVLDVAKAARLPDELGGIYLMDEVSGLTTRLRNSPKTGSIPQNPQKLEAGRTYSLGFPNPSGHFKSGSKVTVMIGNLRAEHLTVL